MTIVGLLPPVYEEGEGLLVDGGYMNNIPVDVMRSMGVDTVIVVDVESKDDSGWRNLMPFQGGVSGWQLLWDRWAVVRLSQAIQRILLYSCLLYGIQSAPSYLFYALDFHSHHSLICFNIDFLHLNPPRWCPVSSWRSSVTLPK